MIDIQVAFQGGGAKLCDLLAAAEALQSLQNEARVVRVAGTSAGAIAACLLATGAPIAVLRRDIATKGRLHLPEVARGTSKLSILFNIWRGRPIYREPALAAFLEQVFTHENKAYSKFRDLQLPVLITAANIRSSEAVVYSSQGNEEMNFINPVLDSCALPFVFRNGVVGSPMVDGGICENLPAHALKKIDAAAPVVAVSFKRDAKPAISTVKDYFEALVDTVIDHSVTRGKAFADSVVEMATDVSTFDFEQCLTVLSAPTGHYQDMVEQCKAQFRREFVALHDRPVPISSDELMHLVDQIHHAQHDPADLVITNATKEIIAYGLLPEQDPQSHLYDKITDTLSLDVHTDNVRSFRLGSSSKFGDTRSLRDWRLLDGAGGRVVSVVPVPIQVKNSSSSSVVFFFGRGLPKANSPYRIVRHSEQKHALNRLKQRSAEYVGIRSTQASEIQRQEIVVHLPTAYENASVLDAADPAYPLPQGVTARPNTRGRAMTQPELDVHQGKPGFVAKGWVFNNIRHGDRVGILIYP